MAGFGFKIVSRSALAALFSFMLFFGAAAAEVLFEKAPLQIRTQKGTVVELTAELAIDDEQRMQGLMFRQSMPQDQGMWFDFGESRLVTMWMKNTILPLDMLFIDEAGKVVHLREHTVPFSQDLISSVKPVRFVLELNAGAAKKAGIGVGSRVDLSTFGASK